jgi:RND family efflux transporter MFP subunit
MKKISPFFCISLLLPLIGCQDKATQHPSQVQRPIVTGVTLTKIVPVLVDSFYQTSGTVKARSTSIVASRSLGAVTSLKIKEGDRVKAGQLLLTIEDRDLTQKAAAAEAGVQEALRALESADQNRSLATVTFTRYKNLYLEKVITHQEMDQIETRKNVAQSEYERTGQMVQRSRAALEESKINLGFAQVKAPVAGLVTEKKIDQGSLAVPGLPLMIIEDASGFQVDAHINERLMGKFKAGTKALVVLETTGERITGIIGEIVPAIDPATRTYLIKIRVTGASLKSGLYCQVFLPDGKKERLLVPQKAVVGRGQLEGVFVVDDHGLMTYRLVRTGKVSEGQSEILSGLKGGEQVVVQGMEKAIDGGMVKQ